MRKSTAAILSAVVIAFCLAVPATQAERVPARLAVSHASTLKPLTPLTLTPQSQRTLIEEYCLTCHDDDKEKGGLSLQSFDPARADQSADVAEKMIRKLRAGMMPPPGQERPDAATLDALVLSLETHVDKAAAIRPNPGRRTFQRLNRAEYAPIDSRSAGG